MSKSVKELENENEILIQEVINLRKIPQQIEQQ